MSTVWTFVKEGPRLLRSTNDSRADTTVIESAGRVGFSRHFKLRGEVMTPDETKVLAGAIFGLTMLLGQLYT